MGINKFNAEGYYDPTTYEALTNVIRADRKSAFKPLAYICSPYSGNVEENIKNAQKYCRFAVENNYTPLAPHLLFPQFMSEETEREAAMFMNMVLLGKCHELWVFGDMVSKGMSVEINRAKRKNQYIRYFNKELLEVEVL